MTQAPQILLAEDDSRLLESMLGAFKARGITLDVATSLTQAKALFDPARHKLVITDNQLGDGYGLDWVRQAKPDNPDTFFLLWSGAWSKRSARENQEFSGADLAIPKGFDAISTAFDTIKSLGLSGS